MSRILQALNENDSINNVESLKQELEQAKKGFDPNYEYSDDHSYWTAQKNKAQKIHNIERKLKAAGENISERKAVKKSKIKTEPAAAASISSEPKAPTVYKQVKDLLGQIDKRSKQRIIATLKKDLQLAESGHKMSVYEILCELQLEGKKSSKEIDYDDPKWDAMVKRVGQMAKEGPRKTVYDPDKRVYKTVPVNNPKEKGVAEAINPDITNPAFSHQQQIGDYLYVARYWSKGLKISAYHGDKQIGYAELMYQTAPFDDFADPKTTPKRVWLESEWTKVNPKYQRQGIMSTMYAYAKMLGNSVKPSELRSPDAKAAWSSWRQSGDAKHLTSNEGVAEATNAGPHIIYATGPRTMGQNDVDLVFKDLRTGKIVAHVVGNNYHPGDDRLQEFAPADRGDGGSDGGDDNQNKTAKYEIRMSNSKLPTYIAFGDPQEDTKHEVYKLGPKQPDAQAYYGHGLTLVSKLDWWNFLEKMLGEIMWEDDAIEAGYVDRSDNGDLVFVNQQGVAAGLNEFAPPGSNDGGDDGFSEETLKRLAAQWYNGDEDPRVERTLMAAGWEIGQDEGYDDEPGVFVVQSGDVNGNSYISWPAHELKQGVAEGLNEMDKSAPQPGRDGKVSQSTYGSRDKKGSDYFKGKEAPGKAITAKQASKDALDILKKQGVAEVSDQTKQSYKAKAQAQVKELEPHAKKGEYKDIAQRAIDRRTKGLSRVK